MSALGREEADAVQQGKVLPIQGPLRSLYGQVWSFSPAGGVFAKVDIAAAGTPNGVLMKTTLSRLRLGHAAGLVGAEVAKRNWGLCRLEGGIRCSSPRGHARRYSMFVLCFGDPIPSKASLPRVASTSASWISLRIASRSTV